jgi:hypothetical protein
MKVTVRSRPGRSLAENPTAYQPRGKAGGAVSPRCRVVLRAAEPDLPLNAEDSERDTNVVPPGESYLAGREKVVLTK